jgi:hypothetical protein
MKAAFDSVLLCPHPSTVITGNGTVTVAMQIETIQLITRAEEIFVSSAISQALT